MSQHKTNISPFLKWVGGKRQLLKEIKERLPQDLPQRRYCEPFIGGGAILFDLLPKQALIGDMNEELINTYKIIQTNPQDLIQDLKKHQNTAEYFYQIRSLDRELLFQSLSKVERASRLIYLNKTCFNGLYRVNASGEFNTPFGRYQNPNIVNEENILAVSNYLNQAEVSIQHSDYQKLLEGINSDYFVYLDPPYHPLSESSNFTGYIQGGWTKQDQIRLRDVCNQLTQRGIPFLLSNSSTDFIRELYSQYNIQSVQATRTINSRAERRGAVSELLISNYEVSPQLNSTYGKQNIKYQLRSGQQN